MNTDNLLEGEVANLRSSISEKMEKAKGFEDRFTEKNHAHEALREFRETPIEVLVPDDKRITSSEEHRLLTWLTPRDTDEKVKMIIQVMADKGIKNALSVVEKLNDPQIDDDFERYLVQYLLSGANPKNDLSKDEWKALHFVLFQIVLPEKDGEETKQAKEMIALMEQWYASMQGLSSDPANKDKNYYSLELSVSNGTTVMSFYCAVHVDYKNIFEKVVQGVFPNAQITECKEDYNIFHKNSMTSCSYATLSKTGALPIKTYKELEGDPLSIIISSFTKIRKDMEGLAIQILVRPAGDIFSKKYGQILDDLRKGETLKRALDKQDFLKESFRIMGTMLSSPKSKEEQEEEKKDKLTHTDEIATKLIQQKLERTIMETNVRIIASSDSLQRAENIRRDLEASFMQFNNVNGNSFLFKEVEGRKQKAMLHRFSYRLWSDDESCPLNLEELASIYHIPTQKRGLDNIMQSKSATGSASPDMPQEGVILGINKSNVGEQVIHFAREDRMRHLYVIGQTGTGKTTILKNLVIQDIKNGDGCCFIDPHGNDILDILANIPKERLDDVIYFDPSHIERPMGLNMLEYDKNFPEQKTFIVNELLGIFNKLFDMKTSGGPGFEQYFRNATLLVMESPESGGNTLLEIARVFSDKDFRDYKLSKSKNPILIQFWQNAEKTTGEQGLANWTQYVTNKFDIFISNDIMRPIIAQEKSSFNFRDIMDNKKIFLVNLSKGRLGDVNSNLLGLIIVGKFLQAALSRVDTAVRPDFYFYIDEFQNITTSAISTILSEARKYRMSLNIAHQYIGQLQDDIKGAVFGNVGSMIVYRVGPDDAKYLETQFTPTFTANDIIKIENYHAYVKMLVNGEPKKPFDISVSNSPKGDIANIEKLKELSYLKFGRPKEEVEQEILKKYQI